MKVSPVLLYPILSLAGMICAVPQVQAEPAPAARRDDGLGAILSGLDKCVAKTADERLYVRRLKTILPLIISERNPNYTSAEYKGNTALHYACGLSHTELVQWLVAHGADIGARTHSGKTPADCVSGANATAIRKILKQGAKTAPAAPTSAVGRTFTFTGAGENPLSLSWQRVDAEERSTVVPGAGQVVSRVEYVRTGAATAMVLYRSESSPTAAVGAEGQGNMVFELQFTSPTGGTATRTAQDKMGAIVDTQGTFTLK